MLPCRIKKEEDAMFKIQGLLLLLSRSEKGFFSSFFSTAVRRLRLILFLATKLGRKALWIAQWKKEVEKAQWKYAEKEEEPGGGGNLPNLPLI